MKRFIRQPLVMMAFAAIAICLLWPRLSKKDKFSYVGFWEGDKVKDHKSRLSFNNDGTCSYALLQRGEPPSACRYEMHSGKAFVTATTPNKNSTTTLFHCSAIPQNNGQTLEFTEIDAAEIHPSGKQTDYVRFKVPAYTLHKIK